jgi:ubiquinone biosynthesis protein
VRLINLPQYKRNVIRFTEIVRVLSKYGLAGWLKATDPEFLKKLFKSKDGETVAGTSQGARMRLAAEELGPTFIKLAQILSTRSDLVGPEIGLELQKLQSAVPADAFDVVQATFAAEIGKNIKDVFGEFCEEPLGSASIGQVHAARLPDGREVVVKIQHADIENRIREDLDILEGLASLAEEFSKDLRAVRPKDLMREFRRTMLHELDYERERKSLDEFARNFEGQAEVHFPYTVPEFSTKRVLTMEKLVGHGFHQLHDPEFDRFDRTGLTKLGANVFLDMIFRDGFYHADPHPGNLLVLEDGRLGVLDCGMTGRVDAHTMEILSSLLLGVTNQDTEDLTYYVSKIGSVPQDLDRGQLQIELGEFVAEYANRSMEDLDAVAAIEDCVAIVRRNAIILRPNISLLLKVIVMLEGTSRLLDRDFSLTEVLDPYMRKTIRQRLGPKAKFKRLAMTAKDWDRLASGFPRYANQILERVDQGQFQINLKHRHLDKAVNRLVLGILSAALFVGSASMLAAAVPPTIWGISVLGLIGGLASLFLGVIVLKAIHNSDDLA